jgi:hypothetical protein
MPASQPAIIARQARRRQEVKHGIPAQDPLGIVLRLCLRRPAGGGRFEARDGRGCPRLRREPEWTLEEPECRKRPLNDTPRP